MDSPPVALEPQTPTPEASTQAGHTRTYQGLLCMKTEKLPFAKIAPTVACIPCRRRKVRCDLGPPDKPHDPPCKRCRRESKDCFFSATRRKKKPSDAEPGQENGQQSDYEIRNGRKRVRTDDGDTQSPAAIPFEQEAEAAYGQQYSRTPLTRAPPSGFGTIMQPPSSQGPEEDEQQVSNQTAAILQKSELYGPHDALTLLFEAAGRTGDIDHHRTGSAHSHQSALVGAQGSATQSSRTSPLMDSVQKSKTSYQSIQQSANPVTSVDPAISHSHPASNNPSSTEYEIAIRAWSRSRVVRAGWFTGEEAIRYIDYFYVYFASLTPITIPDFRHYSTHAKLLSEEPMLAITMLMLSSRYMTLPPGPGSVTRPYTIHDKLWNYLQSTIDRILWGQEQYGGGFCGAGPRYADAERKGLRTLGTIESLLLLTEWHPRTLHFPPAVDNETLVEPEDLELASEVKPRTSPSHKESWLEPCWRSDRMCWMLLGNAMALAIELGVFDEDKKHGEATAQSTARSREMQIDIARKANVKKLLLVYVTQTSGRLNYISMLPRKCSKPKYLKEQARLMGDRLEQLRRGGALPTTIPTRPSQYTTDIIHETVLYLWMELAVTFQLGNEDLFPSIQHTRDIINSGKYFELMEFYNNLLEQWRRRSEQFTYVPVPMRSILMIEYEYSRTFINAIALQAVVERCANNTSSLNSKQNNANEADSLGRTSADVISPSTLMKWCGRDRPYLNIITDASRNALKIVTETLANGDYLKHAPVRTYFRIISVAMLMLKTFALGATEDDLAISLGLLERAAEVLRTRIVDDVHVASRFAEILELLIRRMKSRFVRLAAGGNDRSRAASRSPAPQPGAQQPLYSQQQQQNFGHLSVPQPWPGYSGPPPSSVYQSSGRVTPSNPLYGIAADLYDPMNSSISIMPPPTFPLSHDGLTETAWYNNGLQAGTTNDGSYDAASMPNDGSNGNMNTDWLALPLNPLLDIDGADVTQSAYGPDVGGYDMLEVLLGLEGNMGR
ncbi:MAG: hypothetical protein M1822_003470 [Bathelium mastoideum]|nr:MAG: hypothetical protein M1822_003470 [Bathelium mastoideum]